MIGYGTRLAASLCPIFCFHPSLAPRCAVNLQTGIVVVAMLRMIEEKVTGLRRVFNVEVSGTSASRTSYVRCPRNPPPPESSRLSMLDGLSNYEQ